jgi:uracil-DNA glycosylase
MQHSICEQWDCPRHKQNTKNFNGPFYFPHNRKKIRFIVVTEQYPPVRRYDETGKMKSLQVIENELIDQCKNINGLNVVPRYILNIFDKNSLDIRNGPVYWTHMIKCFSNIGRNELATYKRKDKGHPENKKNIQLSSSQCNNHLQNEIKEFENLEFLIPFGQSAMNSVYEAMASNNVGPSFHQQIELKKPFYRVIIEAPSDGYPITIGKDNQKTIRILPFYHPSRRNIFESRYPKLSDRTNIKKNSGQKPGSFVKILRENYCE